MPSNKEAIIRYRIIDRLIRNKHKPYPSLDNIIDLLEEQLGKAFSTSTIQKDIKAMREDELLGFMAPIKFSKKYKGYYYTDANYTLDIPLNEQDIEAIEFAGQVLKQYKNIAVFSEFGNAVDKIFNAINIHSVLTEEEIDSYVQFEASTKTKGTEFINPIIEHIKNRNCLNINYQRFDSDDPKLHIIHPYLLKEYKNRWYVIGKKEGTTYIITLALDRIIDLNQSDIVFQKDFSFSSTAYFKHAFGITTFKEEPQKVVLQFDLPTGYYIATAPLHKTQKIIEQTEKYIKIELTVGITPELVMAILSYGEWVKVLEPNTLVNQIKERLDLMVKKY